MARLRNKMDRGYRERLIHTVRGEGYVIRSDEMLANRQHLSVVTSTPFARLHA